MNENTHIKEKVVQVVSIALLVAGVTFTYFIANADGGNYCHTINKGSVVSKIYGSPVNFFSGNGETLFKVRCGKDNVILEIGNGDSTQYIYPLAFHREGSVWKKVTLSGTNTVGPWIIGSAHGEVPYFEGRATGKVIVYMCQKVNSAWKCGCSDVLCSTPKWQVQEYALQYRGDLSLEEGNAEPGESEYVLDVHYPSTNHTLAGENITLIGSGFGTTIHNDILWNGKVTQTKVVSKDGGTLTVVAPPLPAGKYEVKVKQGGVVSEYGAVVWIGTGSVFKPTISTITPATITQGGVITIRGEGFTPTNNDVVTTYGPFEGLPSKDGKTITFSYDPFDFEYNTFNEKGEDIVKTEDIHVTIVNTSGVSNVKTFFLES